MGFFSNFGSIGKINTLIKQIEPKFDYIYGEIQYPQTANRARLQVECGTISVLMDEIMSIACNSSHSVMLAPYYFKGKKMSLMDLSGLLASIISAAENLDK